MMTQSVRTQVANLTGSTKASATSKLQADNDFSLFIDKSLKTTQVTNDKTNSVVAKKNATQSSGAQDDANNDDSNSKVTEANTTKTDNTNSTDSTTRTDHKTDTNSDSTKVSDDENVDTKKLDEDSVDEQTLAQLEQMLQSVQQKVCEQLNLSPEEFNQLLSDQGMSLTDLLQPENLQQFILASNGETNIVAALTDENLADTINQLLQTVGDIKDAQSTGLTDEQIQSIMKQAEALKETQSDAVASLLEDGQQSTTQVDEIVIQSGSLSDSKDAKLNENQTALKTSESTVQTETSVVAEDTDTASNSQDNSNKDLDTTDLFQTFVDKLVNASQTVQSNFSDNMTQVTNVREIANQIIDKIKMSISLDQTTMDLQLNPENLGKVNLSIQSKDGIMTANFVVQNELTREAIESQLQTLRDTLNQQGIKVEAIEVTVSSNAFEQNSNKSSDNEAESGKNDSGRQISLEDAMNMTELSEEDDSSTDSTGVTGSLIDYTA